MLFLYRQKFPALLKVLTDLGMYPKELYAHHCHRMRPSYVPMKFADWEVRCINLTYHINFMQVTGYVS